MRTSNKEKDNTISRLKSRLKELEEAFEKAYKLSDNKNTRLKEENKMFQNVSLKKTVFTARLHLMNAACPGVFCNATQNVTLASLNAHLREQKYLVDCFVGDPLGDVTGLMSIFKQLKRQLCT